MNRILTLSSDIQYFSEVKNSLKNKNELEISIFTNSLDMVENLLVRYSDLVILDVDLLGNQVSNMIQVIHSIHRNTKIVLFLSPDKMDLCTTALSFGVISHQVKPVSLDTACEIIRSILQIPSALT